MKKFSKILLSMALVLCVLSIPFAASAAATPVSLMPTADSGYTIMSGDGTVTVADGAMVITNNGDGDLRVTIDNTTKFDLTTLHTLHMKFNAEMPFKMAYQIASDDGTTGWLNTSTNFVGMYTVDAAADRAAKGEYDVNMKTDEITTIVDKSSVYFQQFIILLTGKGTFTLNTVEMTDGSNAVGGDTTSTTGADSTTTTDAPATTTAAKTTAKGGTDSAKTADTSSAVLFIVVAAVAAGTVTLSVAAKKSKAR